MSDWNKYVKQFIPNGNKITVKKVKKIQPEEVVDEED